MIHRTLAFLLIASSAAAAQDQQLGARTKGMGGSYTAFEDDPLSIWMNPAGIATQPDQLAVSYQTYVGYPVRKDPGPFSTTTTSVNAETILVAPAVIPSFLGTVFQIGTPESPMAVGIAFARPYHLNYALDQVTDPAQTTFEAESNIEQDFLRFRAAFARDFIFSTAEEGGWFSHVAVGAGLDVAHEDWQFSSPSGDTSGTAASVGWGFGALVGVYDNRSDFKMNLGFAYQSAIRFDFAINPRILPAFDMPPQFNAGLTFYCFDGTPLRITLDFQWLGWSSTSVEPFFDNQPGFEDVVNFSIGFEYRIKWKDRLTVYPRMGFRRFDAPWSDPDNLPMTAGYKLVLDTKDEVFGLFTIGVGLGWTTEAGKFRAFDIAADVGGDNANVAIGYNHEF